MATHLDNPDFLTIFHSLLITPLSLEALKKKLEKKPSIPADDSRSDALRFQNYIRSIRAMRTKIGTGESIAVTDIDRLLAEVDSLTAFLQQLKAGASQGGQTEKQTKTTPSKARKKA